MFVFICMVNLLINLESSRKTSFLFSHIHTSIEMRVRDFSSSSNVGSYHLHRIVLMNFSSPTVGSSRWVRELHVFENAWGSM